MHSDQPSATRPLFWTNLHLSQFVKTVNNKVRLKFWGKCLMEIRSKNGVSCRRLTLIGLFDRPKSSFGAAVGNSPLFWTNLPFHEFPKHFKPQFVVQNFREFVKRQVCPKWGCVAYGWFGEHIGTKIIASQKNQHIACYYLCNHLSRRRLTTEANKKFRDFAPTTLGM